MPQWRTSFDVSTHDDPQSVHAPESLLVVPASGSACSVGPSAGPFDTGGLVVHEANTARLASHPCTWADSAMLASVSSRCAGNDYGFP